MQKLKIGSLVAAALIGLPVTAQIGNVEEECARFVRAVYPDSLAVMTKAQYEAALDELCTGTPLRETAFERLTELLGLSSRFSLQAAEDVRLYCANSPFIDGYYLFREARDPGAFDLFSACAEFAYAGVRISTPEAWTADGLSVVLSRVAGAGGGEGMLRVSGPSGVACRFRARGGDETGVGPSTDLGEADGAPAAGSGESHLWAGDEPVALECEVDASRSAWEGAGDKDVLVFYSRDGMFSVLRVPWLENGRKDQAGGSSREAHGNR